MILHTLIQYVLTPINFKGLRKEIVGLQSSLRSIGLDFGIYFMGPIYWYGFRALNVNWAQNSGGLGSREQQAHGIC